jgi:hypothetical protein
VTFDESAMLRQGKKSVDVDRDQCVSKQVKLEVKAPEKVREDTSVQPIQEEVKDSLEEEAPEEQRYSIATGRQRRQIRPPQRYGYADLVDYALSVAEDLDGHEPCSYKEVISCRESSQWVTAMSDEIESLYKNQTWELVIPPEGQKIVGCK